MVEFALVFVLFLMLIFSIGELGRLVWVQQSLAFAARAGLRLAQVEGSAATETAIEAVVAANLPGMTADDLDVTVTWPAGNDRFDPVQITATYDFQFIMGSLFGLPNNTLVLTTTAVRNISQ